ncbi:MAG: AAA family ATPase, partial [Acidobacteria bacterium]|nr:AAA family ATPase [Acidobacteriota bacterium]
GDEARGSAAQLMRRLAATWYAQVAPLSAENFSDAKLLAEVKAASQERMKRELANFLQAVAERRPLVLFFDDLHWADVSTIDLLSFLAGKFDALRVLIVVTYRPSDMLLAKHPFLQIKPDLQARGSCRELSLEFLTEAEIAEYLTLEFPRHAFPPDFAQLIHAKTEGSPLFMADLVRYLCDRGVIRRADVSPLLPETELMETFATASLTEAPATWTLAEALPDIERALPESVRGMIERKLAQLSEDDHKLLTAASVQGYEFDSAVVAQVLSLDANEIEERLEKLERVFAVVKLTSEAEFPNGTLTLRYRFVHVLYQNALYASLRATRKATLSRDVAQTLEGCYGARSASVANELALLWEAARDYARASDAFWQAARNAAQIHAHREAVQLAERGLAGLVKLPETPERDGRELGLQLTLGFSLQSVLSWAAPEAGAAFNRARQLCEQVGNDPRLFAALSGVWPYHALQAEFKAAQKLGEQMLQLAEQSQNPALLVRVLMCQAFVTYYQGELVSAHQYGERALALDRREYHAAYLSVSNEDLGITTRRHQSYCLWTLGYADSALALAQETVTLAEQTAHPFSLGGAHLATGMVLHTRRNWQSSQQEFEQVLALAEEYDLGDMLNYAAAFNALTLAYQEPNAAALERAQQAIASLCGKGVTLALPAYLAILGELFGLANRCVEGLAAIAEALAQVERTGERVWEAELWRIKGELLLKSAASDSQASGAQAEAEICYRKALEIARRQSAKAWELRATMSLARLWQQQGKREAARQMLAEIYGWFTEGFATADLQEAQALLDELEIWTK